MKIKFLAVMSLVISFVGCSARQSITNVTLEELNQMAPEEASKTIKHLLRSKDEDNYKVLLNYYKMLGDSIAQERLIEQVIKRKPNSELAIQSRVKRIWLLDNDEERESAFENLRLNHPNYNFSKEYFKLAINFMFNDNISKALEYGDKIDKSDHLRYFFVNRIVTKISNTNSQINKIDFLKREIDNIENHYSGSKKQQVLKESKLNLVNALEESDNITEALQSLEDLYFSLEGDENSSLQSVYGIMLAKCNEYEKAMPILENVVVDGLATDEVKKYLKLSYEALGRLDYESYKLTLMNKLFNKTHVEIIEKIVNKPCPKFTLADTEGKMVKLDDFKGKTVVLDFWATWCGPCKASFPAMKEVVEKYRENENVKFLFVHTFEKDENPLKLAKNYLEENNYNFELYMDYKNVESKTNEAAKVLGIQAIPTKIIIDPQGNIRFVVTGGSIATDKVVSELSVIIDYITAG
ncbi:TlpA family protein disulfide reductase [Aestuariibaculum marinum]|uniref:TlpA family protein disulfide reductase n=1 Tax=Aestuariibaculum marinum TaxID=2683592 RepID=A0A8J6U5J9_9FLAO|nr:TlpA disulfide reductase family protein [Aestuariibaculum marinum]MBD0824952.1 TlpA family protein disulfide reductase [Aestuariibaculum marinum]